MAEIDWDRTVFVIIGPDAIARHLGTSILDRLEGLGFRPVGWRVLWHRPVDLDAFHESNITRSWKAYLYRLVDQLFAYGPTIAMLVRDERPDTGETSHQRLRRSKGASEPAETVSGTIRGDLKSINVMLALMHSADTAADAQHESSVFAGVDGFTGGDPSELRTLIALLDAARPAEGRGYPEVLSGLRGRVLAATWDELTRDARRTAAGLIAAGPGQLAQPGAGKRVVDLLPPAHPLTDVAASDFTPRSPGADIGRVRTLLRAYGTDLDRWEDLVLATSRRFQPRPAVSMLGGLRPPVPTR